MTDLYMRTAEELKADGFSGFDDIRSLRQSNLAAVPKQKGDCGVYVVLRCEDTEPTFLQKSTGGRFKGRDPNVDCAELKSNWVASTPIMYIGKAGSPTSSATLRSRLKQYLDFGMGKPVGHWGGRYLWHLPESEKLVVCWKRTPEAVPREVEAQMIQSFKATFGKRPFANLVD